MLYDVPKPTEALLITGGLVARKPENPYRIVIGGGAWSVPILHRVQKFYIGSTTVNFQVSAQSAQNVDVQVQASVVFSVAPNKADITKAANRFLGLDRSNSGPNEVMRTAQDIFSGETRAIIGSMNVEEMISDRRKLTDNVFQNAEIRMAKFGWQIDSFQINSISDPNGYINALSAPELARVEREKSVAEAQRDAEVAKEEQNSVRLKSDYQRDTDTRVAENKSEIAEAVAQSNAAGPAAEAEAQRGVVAKQSQLATEQARLREEELVAEVIKPAEADAKKKRIEAEAEAAALEVESAAIAANESVVLDKQMIDQMPQIVEALASGLKDSNLTMLGKDQDLTGFMAQIAALAPELRKLAGSTGSKDDSGESNPSA